MEEAKAQNWAGISFEKFRSVKKKQLKTKFDFDK
jgi:hypothetical protein